MIICSIHLIPHLPICFLPCSLPYRHLIPSCHCIVPLCLFYPPIILYSTLQKFITLLPELHQQRIPPLLSQTICSRQDSQATSPGFVLRLSDLSMYFTLSPHKCMFFICSSMCIHEIKLLYISWKEVAMPFSKWGCQATTS